MGPPSSGGTTVGEALNILEQIPGYQALPEPDKLHASSRPRASRSPTATPTSATRPSAGPRLRGLLSDSFAAERARR